MSPMIASSNGSQNFLYCPNPPLAFWNSGVNRSQAAAGSATTVLR